MPTLNMVLRGPTVYPGHFHISPQACPLLLLQLLPVAQGNDPLSPFKGFSCTAIRSRAPSAPSAGGTHAGQTSAGPAEPEVHVRHTDTLPALVPPEENKELGSAWTPPSSFAC